MKLIFLRGTRKLGLALCAEIMQTEFWRHRRAVILGKNMREIESSPDIDASVFTTRSVSHQSEPWRGEGFTRRKARVASVLTAEEGYAALGRLYFRDPLSGKSDSGTKLNSLSAHCHIGKSTLTRCSRKRCKSYLFINVFFKKAVTVTLAGIAVAVFQRAFSARDLAADAKLGNYGRILFTVIGERNSPLGHGEIAVFGIFGADCQSRSVFAFDNGTRDCGVDKLAADLGRKLLGDSLYHASAELEGKRNLLGRGVFEYHRDI